MVPVTRRKQAPRTSRIATRTAAEGERKASRSRGAVEREHRRLERLCSSLQQGAEDTLLAHAAMLQAVSHDLRNSINVVMNTAQLIGSKASLDPLSRKWLDAILRAANELDLTTIDISDYRKLSVGRYFLQEEVCTPADVIEQTLKAVRFHAESKSVQISVEIAPDTPAVLGERARFSKILADLVASAIKFIPRQGTITIKAAPDDEGTRFSVTDTGPGIPWEHRQYVLTIPVWPHGKKTPMIQGTGLAFQVARNIIEAYGGRIWMETEIGRGTTFSFTLPAADDEDEEAAN